MTLTPEDLLSIQALFTGVLEEHGLFASGAARQSGDRRAGAIEDATVTSIREQYAANPELSLAAVAAEFGRTEGAIRSLIQGVTYRNTPGPITAIIKD